MGGTAARGIPQQRLYSPNGFGEDEPLAKTKFAPGAGGRPAVPGGPMLPQNPWAQMAWERQRLLGAMNQPRVPFSKYIVKIG